MVPDPDIGPAFGFAFLPELLLISDLGGSAGVGGADLQNPLSLKLFSDGAPGLLSGITLGSEHCTLC